MQWRRWLINLRNYLTMSDKKITASLIKGDKSILLKKNKEKKLNKDLDESLDRLDSCVLRIADSGMAKKAKK